jgi:hypothetical protein
MLAPVIATAMITGAFSAGFDWLYPVRVVAACAVLLAFRRQYADLGWTLSWPAIGIGAATFAVWLALLPHGLSDKGGWPASLGSVPPYGAAAWLLMRRRGAPHHRQWYGGIPRIVHAAHHPSRLRQAADRSLFLGFVPDLVGDVRGISRTSLAAGNSGGAVVCGGPL